MTLSSEIVLPRRAGEWLKMNSISKLKSPAWQRYSRFMPDTSDRKLTQNTVLALVAVLFFTVAYWPVIKILFDKWMTLDEYSHGLYVLPFIFLMVWRRRSALLNNQRRLTPVGLILLALSTLVYMFGLIAQVHSILFLAMFMAVAGIVLFLGGLEAITGLLTPFVLLALIFPVPEQLYIKITSPLQLMVSQISEAIIQGLGVSIFREGNILSTPWKSFGVVEACSGLRSLITLLTMSVIMGFFLLRKSASKVALAFFSIPTAIFVNILRVVSMIVAFHFWQLDLSTGISHTMLGFANFMIAMTILYLFQWALDRWEIQSN
jgi:exosortase